MKKLIMLLVIALIATVSIPAESLAKDSVAAKGFYSIEKGKEQYYTVQEFKALPKSNKQEMFRGDWYIISSGSVYPMLGLLMSTEELMKERIDEEEFEKEHGIEIDSSGNINTDGADSNEFMVVDIY